MSLSPSSGGSFSSSATLQAGNYPGTDERTPPFPTLQMNYSLECEGQEITPDIHAKLEKGFFLSNDNIWTCYRRNYFSVNCSYTLNPHLSGRPIYLNRGSNGLEHVQALAITLSAAVDGDKGKTIELLQQTPKRDKGPQLSISKQKVSPMPPNKTLHGPSGILPDATRLQQSYPFAPYGAHTPQVQPPLLPLQGEPDENTQISSPTIAYSSGNTSISASTATSSSSSSSAPFTSQPAGSVSSTSPNSQSHTFERIQFKSATANNGKRRAAQQYYTLIVELHADVRDTSKREKKPVWVKVAQRLSVPVVVRGRSPSHYQEQTNSSSGPAPGSSGGGSGSRSLGGPGSGSTTAGAGYGQRGGWASISGMGGSGASSAGFRSAGFSYDPSPSTSHSVSSASSLEGGAVAEPSSAAGAQQQSHGDTHMHGTGEPEIEPYPGYQYFPSPLYDAMQQTLPKVEGGAHEGKFKDEFGQTSLQFGNKCGPGRFQGVDGSRGHFPDLGAMSGY
ncbi:MAG: hypothetical protein M1820_008584 [Bogoriella megaspora]|nr:MAG: hypothetical protein M1820_008584 [Bogoriella megaspora]